MGEGHGWTGAVHEALTLRSKGPVYDAPATGRYPLARVSPRSRSATFSYLSLLRRGSMRGIKEEGCAPTHP